MLIYAPVDVARFVPAPPLPPSGDFRIGLVGNYNPLKGHDYLLRAIALLKSRASRNIKVVLAGARLTSHTEYAARIDAIIETEGISDLVEQRGFVTDVAELLSKLDALVLSSTAEACPIVVLEAMSAGLPVVAADVGGVRELLLERNPTPAGIVVPARNPEALAAALLELASSPDRASLLGNNGRTRAERYFALDGCVALHAEAYRAARRTRRQGRMRRVEAAKPAPSLGN
jgi:glycosyltransferase involved in cell wall biosynthesis